MHKDDARLLLSMALLFLLCMAGAVLISGCSDARRLASYCLSHPDHCE